MYSTLLTLCLLLRTLFITPLTSAYHLARSNSDPPSATPTWSTSTRTGPDSGDNNNDNNAALYLNETHTTTSDAADDTSNWVLTYCNEYFDPATRACTGKCTTWVVAERGVDGIGPAPGTNCIYTSPPFQVKFQVCNAHHCSWSDDAEVFKPWLYPANDQNGVSVYDATGTDWIYFPAE